MLWVKHAPSLQVCFDEASSPAKKCSARFSRSNGSTNSISLFFILLLLSPSRWPGRAGDLSGEFCSAIQFFAWCGTSPMRRGKAKLAAVAVESKLASPGLSTPYPSQLSLSSLCPSKESSHTPCSSLESGNPFHPHCFIPPRPLGTALAADMVRWGARVRWVQCCWGLS